MEYSYALSGSGGTSPYSWGSEANLPAGLSLSSSGVISGTPTAAGTINNVTVTLSDSAGGSVTKNNISITINPAAAVTPVSGINYCITPPFISQDIKPNLLLLIDNSYSMYDLQYADKGTSDRNPFYCYDKTYVRTNTYAGYFVTDSIYKYNWTSNKFETAAVFPACNLQIPSAGSASELCLTGSFTTAPKFLTDFYARGNYLNWLTSSKFDNLKKILTGGNYDNALGAIIAESRGCVGRMFIKEPIQEASFTEGGINTDLGITFGIRGPNDSVNPTLPSPGGQTFIDIYGGNYNQAACQNAIQVYTDPASNANDQRTATAPCLGCSDKNCNDPGLPGKTSNVYVQTVQECWQYTKASPNTVGTDAVNTVKNQCPDVYDGYSPGKCAKTGTTCALTSECTASFGAGYTCENNLCVTGSCTTESCGAGSFCVAGPRAIFPGNPALLCSSSYAGACYTGLAPYNKSNYTGCVGTDCGDDCIIAQHNKYCGESSVSPVVDPTDDPSATETYDNLPAILGGASMQGQLGVPLTANKQITVRINAATEPTGRIQDFKDFIRFGVMTFNNNGSVSECDDSDILKCPRNCSNDKSRSCTTARDCAYSATAATCDLVTSSSSPVKNLDAGFIKSYIGDPVGDHNSGIIRTIDIIPARTWTPYAEAYYGAIAYFTQNTTSGTARPYQLNSTDFDITKNPVQSSCQSNNILLISDGMSTADQNQAVLDFVAGAGHHDADTSRITSPSADGSVVPKYFGSTNIDDVAYYARHTNIFNASNPIRFLKEAVSNYVIYTGIPCPEHSTDATCATSGETIPEKLMIETARDGRDPELNVPTPPIPNYYLAENPTELQTALTEILTGLSNKAASGTAASVLASGEGSGANLIQAVFYPLRQFDGNTKANWLGRLTNLWYYVDPRFSSSGIYEDNGSTSANILDLRQDNLVLLYYDSGAKVTKASRKVDNNNDGIAEVTITPDINFELISSLWDSGTMLWKRAPLRIPWRGGSRPPQGAGLSTFQQQPRQLSSRILM